MENLVGAGYMEVPTFSFGAHVHEVWEVAYYYYGTGVNLINGTAYEFSPGTVICQPPRVPHEERSESGYKNYFFSVGNIGAPDGSLSPIIFRDTANGDLFNIIKQLHYEWRTNGHRRIAEALADAAIAYIAELSRASALKNTYVERFERTLAANLSDPEFNITEAASKLPFSANHFRVIFKRETGFTPKRYLQQLRIEQAKSLLRTSTLPVCDVGRICGFADQYYFSRCFRAETGQPPSRYRRSE